MINVKQESLITFFKNNNLSGACYHHVPLTVNIT